MFGHLLLKLGGGIDNRHTCNMPWKGVSGQARVHGGGLGEGVSPTPLEIGKKDAIGGNFDLFHLCFCNNINLRILLPADNGNIIYSRHRRPSLF